MDAFSPFPIEELSRRCSCRRSTAAAASCWSAASSACSAASACRYWVAAIAYPLNIGGRPLISWPSFIPVTFEMTILFAALTAVLSG